MAQDSPFIDVTLRFSEQLPIWPGDAGVSIRRLAGMPMISELCMGSHTGTHLDAPAHFIPQGATVDQLSLDVLIGPAWLADVSGNRLITAAALDRAQIPTGVERLLLKTDNSRPKHSLLPVTVGTPNDRPAFDKDFVALDATAAAWLLSRHIGLIGIDGPSIDSFTSVDHPAHHLLLRDEVIIVENLALAGVDPGAYRLICLPLHYQDGDGAPVRAVLECV